MESTEQPITLDLRVEQIKREKFPSKAEIAEREKLSKKEEIKQNEWQAREARIRDARKYLVSKFDDLGFYIKHISDEDLLYNVLYAYNQGLKSVGDDELRSTIVERYLLERCRPARLNDYKHWLMGYLLKGGEPTRFVAKPGLLDCLTGNFKSNRFIDEHFLVAEKNLNLVPINEGPWKIIIPVPNGQPIVDGAPAKGFELHLMDGFKYVGESKESEPDVPYFDWIKFGPKVEFDPKVLEKR